MVPDDEKAKKILLYEKVRASFERLQLAWIRACLTLLALGAASMEYYLNRIENGRSPFLDWDGRIFSLLILSSIPFILAFSALQHQKRLETLKKFDPKSRTSLASWLTGFLMFLSFIIAVLFWQKQIS